MNIPDEIPPDPHSHAEDDWPDPMASCRRFNRAAMRAIRDKTVAGLQEKGFLAREVERRMAERLDLVRVEPEFVLDAGSGLGEGLSLLATRYPKSFVLGIDGSQGMLQAARQLRPFKDRLPGLGSTRRTGAVCGLMERLPFSSGSFGLLWSNLALSWAGDPLTVFRECARVVKPGGLLMFSSFGPDTLRELRTAFACGDRQPRVHRFVDMHDLGDMLTMSGFHAPVMDMETITLTYRDACSLLQELKLTGQTNVTHGRPRGLLGKQAYRRALDALERMRMGERLQSTIEIVYGHAWRSENKVAADGRQVVKFELKKTGLRSK